MVGIHMLVDYFGVDPVKLRDERGLMQALGTAVRESGFTVIKEAGSHAFPGGGQGVTGFILLAQSHAAFHSYPEHGYLALDVYSCGKSDPERIARDMERYLVPEKTVRSFRERG